MKTGSTDQATGNRVEFAVVAAVHAALTLVATWPLAWRMRSALPGDLGDPLLNTFILGWDADRLAHGLVGLWDAPFFFPFRSTLAYSEHLLGIAFFTAPLQWVTGNPVLVYNCAFLAAPVLAGVGMYGLARELWGRRDAAWVAAIAFAFAPHRVMHVSHIQVLMSGWMPVALWALHRYFRTGSRRALAGFVAAFCLLGLSNGYFLYFFALAVLVVGGACAAILVGRGLRGRPVPVSPLRALTDLAAGALVVGLVFTPVGLAYYGTQRDLGLKRTVEEAQAYSARPGDYLRVDADVLVWSRLLGEAPAERSVFPGGAVVVLAGLGLLLALPSQGSRAVPAALGRAHVLMYVSVAALAYWLSLGPRYGLYGRLMSAIPGFDGLRVPARFIVVLALALAVLGAAGVAWLLDRIARPRWSAGLAAGFGCVIFLEGFGGPLALEPFGAEQRQRMALHAWLAHQPEGAILELPIAGPDLGSFTLPYQYATLLHGRPIVNGYSGWGSPLQNFLAGPGSPVHRLNEIDDLLEALSMLGVRYVVLHRSAFASQLPGMYVDPQPFADAMDRSRWVADGRTFLPTQVWRLKPSTHTPAREDLGDARLMAAGYDFQVTASHRGDRLKNIIDGDPRTTWLNGQPQEGNEWIELELARPRDVVRIELGLPVEASANYPRHLRVESIGPDGNTAVLFDRAVLPEVLAGIVRDSRNPVIELTLPANESARLRIAQRGRTAKWRWEISELRAWRR